MDVSRKYTMERMARYLLYKAFFWLSSF
jgi:hypothetical protein